MGGKYRHRGSVAALFGAIVAGTMTLHSFAHQPTQGAPAVPFGISSHPYLSIIKAAPDFILKDSMDHRFALSQLRGRVVLLSFIYSSCTTTCPLLTQRMGLLKERFEPSGQWASSVSFVTVTIDPERDTGAALGDYARRLDAIDPNWWFLREEPRRLEPVLAAYDEWTRPLPNGELDHPARVFLIDAQGNIREVYALSFFDEQQVFADIEALLREAR
jgi:protein SCO1/2